MIRFHGVRNFRLVAVGLPEPKPEPYHLSTIEDDLLVKCQWYVRSILKLSCHRTVADASIEIEVYTTVAEQGKLEEKFVNKFRIDLPKTPMTAAEFKLELDEIKKEIPVHAHARFSNFLYENHDHGSYEEQITFATDVADLIKVVLNK